MRLVDKLVNLVSSEKLHYSKSEDPNVRIELYDDSVEDDLVVSIPDAVQANKQPKCEVSDNYAAALKDMALFKESFVYLNANRLSPQSEYLKGNDERFDSRLGDRTGHRTVFRLQEAYDNNEEVSVELLRQEGNESVMANVDAWISYIMGATVSVVPEDANPSEGRVSLVFDTPSTGGVSALNMAFGHTYILPIIVGILTAKPGSLLIVENPEAHLHPKAQLRMGEFLAYAAQGGIQVFVETHSDHLLNGVRVAAKKKVIEPLNVAIHFIEEENEEHTATEITLREDGSLDKWPKGFFDEWENALREITS